MKTPQALESVIDALKKLPGVGPKAAQRMAFHLMQHDKGAAQDIAEALINALSRVRHCERCNNFRSNPYVTYVNPRTGMKASYVLLKCLQTSNR